MLLDLRMHWQSLTNRTRGQSSRTGERKALPALIARAPLLVTVALAVAVVAQASVMVITLLGDIAIGASSAPTAGHVGGGASRNAMQLAEAAIVRAHLFGSAPVAAAAASGVVSRAPLVLTGIIATGDPKDGFAILGSSVESARVFHTGSEAAPGVLLAEVYPQQVVVIRGGDRVTLTLPRAGSKGFDVRVVRAHGAALNEVADSREDGSAASGPAGPAPEDFKPPTLSDASTLARAFALRPASVGGERGVRIMGTGINSNTLAALGLAPGDVIMQIDGVPIGTRNTPDIGKVLSAGGSVTLVVNRDGGETSVTIDPGSAANAANAYRQSAPSL